MQGRAFKRPSAPMSARPSRFFLLVLACLFLAFLHFFSQSTHLSPASALHDSTIPQLMSTRLTIAKQPEELLYEGVEARIQEEVTVSKITDTVTNHNAGSEDMQFRQAEGGRDIAPDLNNANVNSNEEPITNAGENHNLLQQFATMLGQASSQNTSRKLRVQKEGDQQPEEFQQRDEKPTTNIANLKDDPQFRMQQLTHTSLSKKMLHVQASNNQEFDGNVEDSELASELKENGTLKLTNQEFKGNEDGDLGSELKGNGAIKLTNVSINEPNDSHKHASPQPAINSTAKERLNWLKNNWGKIKILNTGDHYAKEFSTRMENFLTGTGACEARFFMIWIAPLSAFGLREKLAVESVFKSHPAACLVILSHTLDSPAGRRILEPLTSRGFKVLSITPYIPSLVQSTPAEKWFKGLKEGTIEPGTISINQNLSNLLRLVILYEYGGVYIDNDIIVMKSFANFSNVIGAQNIDRKTGKWNRLNNAVMAFERKSPLLLRFMEEFYLKFNGSKWGHNGPYLVSRVLMKERDGVCKVMDPLAFYPVDWDHIRGFFEAPHNSVQKEWVAAKLVQLSQHTFSVHLWNKFSRDMEVEPGSIMESIFQRFCILCDPRSERDTAHKNAGAL